MGSTSAGSRYQIESVVRACRVLTAFRSDGETLRLKDLAERADLSPSTSPQLLSVLKIPFRVVSGGAKIDHKAAV